MHANEVHWPSFHFTQHPGEMKRAAKTAISIFQYLFAPDFLPSPMPVTLGRESGHDYWQKHLGQKNNEPEVKHVAQTP